LNDEATDLPTQPVDENPTRAEARRAPTAFVLIPFAGEFEDVYQYGIVTALNQAGYVATRPDDLSTGARITTEIIRHLATTDLVIADVSNRNPNIFYEVGIAHSLQKPTVLISRDIRSIPFDLRDVRVIVYKTISDLKASLLQVLFSLPDGDLMSRSVLEGLGSEGTAARARTRKLELEIERLQGELAAKQEEVNLLHTQTPEGSEIARVREEVKRQLAELPNAILTVVRRELIETAVELERLRLENESLRSAEQELRRLKAMTLVKPRWAGADLTAEDDLCFLLMSFREPWSDDVWILVERIVRDCGYRCQRADEKDGRIVMEDIWTGLVKARYIIADLTAKNPNVTYEVGLADVLGKDVILLSQSPHDIPFDFLGLRLITYENSIGGVRKLSTELTKRLGTLRQAFLGSNLR
jgi:hypothetical protein